MSNLSTQVIRRHENHLFRYLQAYVLQHKLIFYGQYFLKINCYSRLSLIPYRSVSYDPHESHTVPHHIHPITILKLTDKLPSSSESECETLITGADSFIPDGRLIMNESAEIDNYFVASGSNGYGIALVGGVGKYIAELIHNGNTNLCTCHIYAMRLIHTGEGGFMFFIPSKFALYVYNMLMKQGKDYGLINARSMSIGILSSELIYRNGEFCGFLTSTVYGFTFEKKVCLGFVHAPSSERITVNYIRGSTYKINIATKRFEARPNVYQPTEMDSTVLLHTN
ncbi:unnamed protein product [Adineta steineri]|uniref:Aminomethyltransferase C-terminal domain-containing protein n=1 Tax=Adineta steineri TaxID=433720 RepID=A0A813UVM5_9BILA|nr:unnamed protein product [Adineta steineri]